jgi:Leucine rich repeat
MIADSDIELILLKFGEDWPASASIAEPVIRRIGNATEAPPHPRPLSLKGRGVKEEKADARSSARGAMWKFLLPSPLEGEGLGVRGPTAGPARASRRVGAIAAAALILSAIATWFYFAGQSNSLSAQVIRAMERAKSLDAVTFVRETGPHGEDRGLKQAGEARFVDGQGFRYELGDEIRVGNDESFWQFNRRTKTAFRSASGGIRKLVNEWFDVRKFARELQADYEREPTADVTEKNDRLKAYRLVPKPKYADPALRDGSLRTMVFLDSHSRIARVEALKQQNGAWRSTWVQQWSYDVPVDPTLFEPNFGPDVKVVDSDRAFDELVDLQRAIHVEDRAGLIYAVHRVERFQGGGLLVMSSVRSDEETLKRFPLERRMIQLGLYHVDGPATNYEAIQGSGYFRFALARASHQGIDIQWWIQVPRMQPANYFDIGANSVWIMAGMTPSGKYAMAHANAKGVIDHVMWKLELPAPSPPALPTLSAIAESVYADVAGLGALPAFDLSLDLGIDDSSGQPVGKRGSGADTTPQQFTEAVERHVRWWFRQDLEFQFKYAADPASAGNETVALNYLSDVGDAELARVRSLPKLKRLYLAGTQITDAGLAAASGLSQLKELDLSNTAITDAGLERLTSLHNLKVLYLKNTPVTDRGIQRVKAANPRLKVVRK